MRFGVTMFLTDRSMDPVSAARAAEERGFDSIFVPEHTHIPAGRKTPAPMGEPLPDQYYRILDPFVALTAAATATTKLRVGTGISLVAQRDPIVTAKEVATLDHISGGRFVFGIGFGWNEDELCNHGVDFADRRAVVRERILAMKELWTEELASFEGETVSFEKVYSYPKPAQKPHPPVFIGGGGGPKMFAAVAEYADGWMPIGGRGVKANIGALHEACDAIGRDPATVRIVPFGTIPDPGKIEYMATLGIDEIVLGLNYGRAENPLLAEMDSYAEIVAPYRD